MDRLHSIQGQVSRRQPTRSVRLVCRLSASAGSCPSAWCKSVSPGGLECAVLSAAQQAGEWEEYR